MTAPSPLSLVARLRTLTTSAVSDVLDQCGYRGQSIASAIAPLDRATKLAGVAACLEGVSEDSDDRAPALPSTEIDRRMAEGAVLVIAMNGHRASAAVGGLMCLAARRRRCAGFVVDGGVRDAPEIVELGMPTFCRYVTPLNSGGRWHLARADVEVALPGQASARVSVSPGDFLIGDGDGLIAIPKAIAERVIAWTERLAEIEQAITRRIDAGASREEAFAEYPRFKHIGRLKA
ncbi:MAG TPA: RraA family protein [Casimicrobiaceae bacterium]|nr:RraA family protein [Casimicrobiaceae bacterium]